MACRARLGIGASAKVQRLLAGSRSWALAVKTRLRLDAMVGNVQPIGNTPAHQAALREFVEAVLAFTDDPGPANLERYLAASRGLEEPPQAEPARPRARPRAKGTSAGPAPLQTR